ncbi:hypothetical protein H5410_014563 [Solanum commersonii]|uniref:Uncharacterized protein n=1 Tax=Solanum commersonii TaxID=4109 RepID=A0A9J5ZRK9_SOLCO|nr:hypothetical protein H5410_014563 [Solanum commersonii]
MVEAARILNIEAPDLYIRQSSVPNAYTLAVSGVGSLIARRTARSCAGLEQRELTCDRAALLVAQDPKVVVSVLMKLAGGCPSLSEKLNVDAFLEQARSYI